MELIKKNIDRIKEICRLHKVSALYLFGSILTPSFSKASDVDMVVKFGKVDLYDYADNYFSLKEKLEATLGRSIDLLEEQAIRNPFLKQTIDESKVLIYG